MMLSKTTSNSLDQTGAGFYSQTFENKSSDPPNPPLGLAVFADEGAVGRLTGAGAGAALAQPPKSSSPETTGAGFDAAGAPHPLPKSFAVNVAGTRIESAAEGALGFGAAGAGAGSGVLQALSPQGSLMAPPNMAVLEAAVTAGRGAGGWAAGDERLKAELLKLAAGAGAGFGAAADVDIEGDDRPKKSLEAVVTGAGFAGAGVDWTKPPKSRSPKPDDEATGGGGRD